MSPEIINAYSLQLQKEYDDICWRYSVPLRRPLIHIVSASSYLGRWHPFERRIELTENLLTEWCWDDVCSVLKHEMAHQIVSEIFNEDDVQHGPSFARAGEMLGLAPRFLKAKTETSIEIPHQNQTPGPLILKIEKLLSLAQSENENEARLAMQKAQELLSQNHIDNLQKNSAAEFTYSSINTGKQKTSALQSRICGLLIEFYFVDIVIGETFNIDTRKKTKTIELYGREENVKIAEYTYHFLLNCTDNLWKNYIQKNVVAMTLKKSYMIGLIVGFENKLLETEKELLQKSQQGTAIVPVKSLLLKEKKALKNFIKNRHPRLSRRSRGRQMLDKTTYTHGIHDGRHIVVHKGITTTTPQSLRFLKSFF